MSTDLTQLAAALADAGHPEAAQLLHTIAAKQPQQQDPRPVVVDGQAAAGDNAADERFARQIREAQQKSGGWQSVPLGTSDDGGRF